jgi:hypothetical protein
MPEDETEWVSIDEENTTLRHCGYWISLRGKPMSQNASTETIRIPKEQIFNELALKSIMEQIRIRGVL